MKWLIAIRKYVDPWRSYQALLSIVAVFALTWIDVEATQGETGENALIDRVVNNRMTYDQIQLASVKREMLKPSIGEQKYQTDQNQRPTVGEETEKPMIEELLQRRREEIEYVRPEKPTVYLTFDDGPSGLTLDVLDILEEEGVSATFFVLGSQVERYEDTVKRIVEEGHAVGNHTYDHRYEDLYTDFASFFAQVTRTDELIYEVTGTRTQLFRSPGGSYGNLDEYYQYYLYELGFTIYDWHVDSGDARRRGVPAAEIIAQVKDARLRHELIVLLHDGAGHEETVKALPEIIHYYKDQGYEFAALDISVEPRTLSLGTLRWTRTNGIQQHLQYMEMIEQYVLAREASERVVGGEVTDREETMFHHGDKFENDGAEVEQEQVDEADEHEQERLVLKVHGRKVILDEGNYDVVKGHFQVPLDSLVEAMGGRLDRGGYGSSHRIRVTWHDQQVVYDLSDKSMTIRQREQDVRTYSSIRLMMQGGRVYVPLRGTVEALGGSIPSYSLSGRDKEVDVHHHADRVRSGISASPHASNVWRHLRV